MDGEGKFVMDKITIIYSQMAKYYHHRQLDIPTWKSDDEIWLDSLNTRSMLQQKKLCPKMYRPFELIRRFRKNTVNLMIPDT